MRNRLRLYVGVALAGGSWAFAIAWTSRNRNCVIDECWWTYFLWWTGLGVILLGTVALLARVERTRFPLKPLILIDTLLIGSALLSLVVVGVVGDETELVENTIGLAVLFVLGIPPVFVLASLAWLLFRPRHESTGAGTREQ